MSIIQALKRSVGVLGALLFASGALAQSPAGQWEMSISGKVLGASAIGIAYIEILDDGSLEGFAEIRGGSSLLTVSGSWTGSGSGLFGSLSVTSELFGDRSYEFIGTFRDGRSVSMSCFNGDGDRIRIAGRPAVEIPDCSGVYLGSMRQYGLWGVLEVTVVSTEYPGLYELGGLLLLGGQAFDLAGHAVVNRRGSFVANLENLTSESLAISSVWGSIRPGQRLSGVGLDIFDGSAIRFSLR